MRHTLKRYLRYFPGAFSLRTVLSIYFIPISVLPALGLSYWSMRSFEKNLTQTLILRANSEKETVIKAIANQESEWLTNARKHASNPGLIQAVTQRNTVLMDSFLSSIPKTIRVRMYDVSGSFLTERKSLVGRNHIAFLSPEVLRRLQVRAETIERYFSEETKGILTVIRILLSRNGRAVGVLEEEIHFGPSDLAEMKFRRQADLVFVNRQFSLAVGSFALPPQMLKSFSVATLRLNQTGHEEPLYLKLGGTRYAAFLYDLPSPLGKSGQWGYFALFLPMTMVDTIVGNLKVAMVGVTLLLIFLSAILIFLVSQRLVQPIEKLVQAMKRLKLGYSEQIPSVDSTYEIEYLVRAFNDMTRNVSAAKRTLEQKLAELHRANAEIKDTQGHLVQSAKMVSLGQLVAGVAHELNNPIAFIYSNLHQLDEYMAKFKTLIDRYRSFCKSLPETERAVLEALEKEFDLDFLLQDTDQLIRSCVEGANRTKDIVLSLRTFSRIDETTFQNSELTEGIHSTLKLLSVEFKDRIRIHLELEDLPKVECSLSQLNQVFMNLLSNAAQAIEGKGDIWIRSYSNDTHVFIEIEDNGIGMEEKVLEKVFDPFFTTKKVGEGTGLGLSIAYSIIQKHHGTIQVESVVGKGTRFTLSLPLRQSSSAVA